MDTQIFKRLTIVLIMAVLVMSGLSGCTLMQTPTPTVVPPTNTAVPPTDTPIPTDTPVPTDTPLPTDTPTPTNTATPVPTDTPVPTETPDKVATAAAKATEAAAVVMAQIQKDLEPYELTLDEGNLAWFSEKPVELSLTSYNSYNYEFLDSKMVLGNFIVKYDVTWSSTGGLAGCGLYFRADENIPDLASYRFATLRFSGLPAWDITYWNYGGIDHRVTGEWKFSNLIDLDQSATNSYMIKMDGDEITVYTNGGRLGTFYSTKKLDGRIAFTVLQESGETTCEFDNAWVWELP